jgi:hypothetical protein
MHPQTRQLALGLAFITGLLVVVLGQLPGNSLLWREAQNSAHILAFGGLSIIALIGLRTIEQLNFLKPLWGYLLAAIISLSAGIAVELVQWGIGRDAELHDIQRDLIGIVSFLGLYTVFDPDLAAYRLRYGKKRLYGVALLSLLLFITGLIPLISLTIFTYQKNTAFPRLIDFEQHWPLAFISPQDARIEIVRRPDQWQDEQQLDVARITLFPSRYPGFALHEPVSQWSGFRYLSFKIYAETGLTLALRINDRQHNQAYEDRYTTALSVSPGINHYRISLDEIRTGPSFRELDMDSIDKLMLFATEPDTPLQFYVGNFYLE